MPATLHHPRASKTRPYIVKLEYQVQARSHRQAVDALTFVIRSDARTTVGVTCTAELLRTDVRRPGEEAGW